MSKRYKVLFLFANSYVAKGLANPDALRLLVNEAAESLGADLEVFTSYARSLSYFISNNKTKIRDHRNHMNLEDYDFVYFRRASTVMQQMLTCALYLMDHEIPFFDMEIAKTSSRNKLSQMYMLQRKSIPIPKTLYCRNNKRLARLVEKKFSKDFNFPLIVKATAGNRGDANYLVKSLDELNDIIKDKKRHFIVQEFIPNEGDLRVFVAGGVVGGVIRRHAVEGSHLNNTSKGGSAEILSRSDFSSEVMNDALSAALVFDRNCAGVDVIFNKDNNRHYLLEVNRAPQIEESSFEKEKAVWLVESIKDSINNYQRSLPSIDNDTFGRFESVRIVTEDGLSNRLVAKVDTGADSSSLHATNMAIDGDILTCQIAGKFMAFSDFCDKKVKSSNGVWQHRYLVELPIKIGEKVCMMKVTLNDRSGMNYDMLIGRRFLYANHLYVDVSRRFVASGLKKREVK